MLAAYQLQAVPVKIQDPVAQSLDISEPGSFLDDLGLAPFLETVKVRKLLLIIVPVLWLLISNVWFLVAKTLYQGELQVMPATAGIESSGSGLGGLLNSSGLGGLLGGGGGNDSMFSIYTESWTSPWFAQALLQNQDLTHRIFSDSWMPGEKQWKPTSGGAGTVVKSMFGARFQHPRTPDAETMLSFLATKIKIQHTRGEVMTLITLELNDRALIRDILAYGHQRITNHIREIYQKRAEGSIGNILNELQHVTVSEYRSALVNELAGQEKVRMMAYANDQFAAQSLGIYITTTPTWPKTSSIVSMSLLFSIAIYALCIVFLTKWQSLLSRLWSARAPRDF